MLSTLLSDTQEKFGQITADFKKEIAVIRAGRATPALVEDISIEAYESRLTIKELATISVPEANLIVVSPWDSQVLENIVAGIRAAGTGLEPVVDGNSVKVPVPSLSEERRQEMIKKVGTLAEESKVKIRQIRHEKIKSAEEMEEEKLVSEDDLFRFKENLQKEVEAANSEVDSLRGKKEEELGG